MTVGSFLPNTAVTPWSTLAANHPELTGGGKWKPVNCTARQRVVVVVPYRDRDEHLRILLQNLHPVLQRQQLEYHILVVEQAFPHIFNKASLMNIGFRAALKLINFDCIVFHDVDMLPSDDRQQYTCFHPPTHLGAYLDKYGFGKRYVPLFGGVTVFTRDDYVRVNGFSNLYWGWGGEDDEMGERIAAAKLNIYRYPLEVSRYRMLRHGQDHMNPVNPFRRIAFRPLEYVRDGLSNTKYRIHSHEERSLYTWLLVELGQHADVLSKYRRRPGDCSGGDISGFHGVVNASACAEKCNKLVECVGFVHVTSAKRSCYLKFVSCVETSPKNGAVVYDVIDDEMPPMQALETDVPTRHVTIRP